MSVQAYSGVNPILPKAAKQPPELVDCPDLHSAPSYRALPLVIVQDWGPHTRFHSVNIEAPDYAHVFLADEFDLLSIQTHRFCLPVLSKSDGMLFCMYATTLERFSPCAMWTVVLRSYSGAAGIPLYFNIMTNEPNSVVML